MDLFAEVVALTAALESVWQTRARVAFAPTDAPGSALWVVSRGGLITLKLAARPKSRRCRAASTCRRAPSPRASARWPI